jgi:hypothetical protein
VADPAPTPGPPLGPTLGPADLRAAVAAGIVTEAQAASMTVLAQDRAGKRRAMPAEDEPFELFRGFAEIFVATGIVLLISGILALAWTLEGPVLPALAAGLCWLLALYFTRRRRMVLPSIVLAVGFAGGSVVAIGDLLSRAVSQDEPPRWVLMVFALLLLGALGAYFRAFKVPFVAFLAGLAAAGLVFLLVDLVFPFGAFPTSFSALFDLRHGTGLPLATLIFGLLALAAGLWCDMRDPHRLGRWSATGFWCHLLAAPALVNTIAMTAYNAGGPAGNLLLGVALAAVALLALVIDRRSFLTAGIAYLGILIGWALSQSDEGLSMSLLLLILGAFLTGMGTWWTDLRAGLMRALPDFPGKDRLPPYASTP